MGKAVPPTAEDKKLSKKHLKASVKFNKEHIKDHLKAAKKAEKLLHSDYAK